jgi:hypothetical protein
MIVDVGDPTILAFAIEEHEAAFLAWRRRKPEDIPPSPQPRMPPPQVITGTPAATQPLSPTSYSPSLTQPAEEQEAAAGEKEGEKVAAASGPAAAASAAAAAAYAAEEAAHEKVIRKYEADYLAWNRTRPGNMDPDTRDYNALILMGPREKGGTNKEKYLDHATNFLKYDLVDNPLAEAVEEFYPWKRAFQDTNFMFPM